MGRQLKRAAAVLAGALLLAGAASPASAAESEAAGSRRPIYDIQPCCQLCPRAADPAAYTGSSYLEEFRTLEQGRDGWLFRSRVDMATRFDITDESLAELRRLANALRKRGTELVVVLQPPRALMDPDKLGDAARKRYDFADARRNYAQALQRIRSAGVTVPPLDQLIDENKGYEYFFRRDHHWTPSGAERTARVVAGTVSAMPAFAGVPRKQFVTRTSALIGKPGTLQKVATQICGGAYSMQYVNGSITEPADSAGGALLGDGAADASGGGLLDTAASGDGGLLGGDDGAPQIALIGTSNSDSKGGYNFAGYLQQHLGADVLAAALAGGSFDGALLRYLPSETFRRHPPKILVWEMPWQNWPAADKNPYKSFRQALPLVADGCRGRSAAMTQTVQLAAGSNELLFNAAQGGEVKAMTGERYWLDFQFDDPTVKDLHAVIWYFSGQRESLKLHFNQYVDNAGRFVTELRRNRADYAQATFMGATLELEQPPAKPTKVTVQICEVADVPQQTASLQEKERAHD